MRWQLIFAALLVALSAQGHPGAAIVVDRGGTIYFVDTGSGIYRVDAGKVTRIAGPAFHWMALDAERRFARTPWPSPPGAEFRRADGHPALILSSDFPVTIGRDGAFYYAQTAEDGARMMRVLPGGETTSGVRLPGSIRWINGLTTGPDGSLYYTEDTAVRRLTPKGKIETIAAGVRVPNCERTPALGPDAGAYLRGLHVMPDRTIFVAASGCGALLKITPAGAVTTVLRMRSPWSPTAVTAAGQTLFVLEYLHTASDERREWIPRVRKIEPNGTMSIVAQIER